MKTVDTEERLHSEFEKLLTESAAAHGHCFPGQVLGVRMAMLGLRKVGIDNPKGQATERHHHVLGDGPLRFRRRAVGRGMQPRPELLSYIYILANSQ